MKDFTPKQVFILVFAIIVVFSFLHTSGPLWTFIFWRKFLLNILMHGIVSLIVMIALIVWTKIFD